MRGKQTWEVDIDKVHYNFNEQDSSKASLIRGQSFRLIRLANEISLVKLSEDFEVIDSENGGAKPYPLRIISKSQLAVIELINQKMSSVLVTQLSNILGRNLHEVEVFKAELEKAIELFHERPQFLKDKKKMLLARAKKRKRMNR